MKISTLKQSGTCLAQAASRLRAMKGLVLGASVLLAANLFAVPTITTVGGGPITGNLSGAGYKDGDLTSQALFHTPAGIALDTSGNLLYVADRDNNAVRLIDFAANWVSTFATNLVKKPVGVTVDGNGNVYVLNRGNNTNGSVLTFDSFGDLIATNATGLTNANGIALDIFNNIYVTAASNQVIKIDQVLNTTTTIFTATNVNTLFEGLVVLDNGNLAVCDAGRNGIWGINPTNGATIKITGFNGKGDAFGPTNFAKFNTPFGITKAANGFLVVSDYGNNRAKVVKPDGTVTNLYGVASNFWITTSGQFPGLRDGTVCAYDASGCPEARLPWGVAFAPDGSIYSSEAFYHVIRKTTSTGLPTFPPPPPPPSLGWVNFVVATPGDAPTSVFEGGLNKFVFNNDTMIAIRADVNSSTVFTEGPTPTGFVDTVPNPTPTFGTTPILYPGDGYLRDEVTALFSGNSPGANSTPPSSDFVVKAMTFNSEGGQSTITSTRFVFKVGNPSVIGDNEAQFHVSDVTSGAIMYYTIDGSDPSTNHFFATLPLSGIGTSNNVFLPYGSNITFKVRGFRAPLYLPSDVITINFSASNFVPNRITFGTTNNEPHSSFIARPDQIFYAPITLLLQPGGETMYSLQFNVAVTNGISSAAPQVAPGDGIDFFSMLMAQVPPSEGRYFPPEDGQWYLPILPVLFTITNSVITNLSQTVLVPSVFVNGANNLLGAGFLYRLGYHYTLVDTNTGFTVEDFDTKKQDLITFSIAHDTLFNKSGGTVIVGAYSFHVPPSAVVGNQYFIQLGSPSATRDGVGAPGADVFIKAPDNNQIVNVGSPFYLVGDAAPFHWLNAGDFGDGVLNNADVMQAYETGITLDNLPPTNSDLYASMDSSGSWGTFDPINGYFTNSGPTLTTLEAQAMYDGNDTSINTNIFGDGVVDITDVYVTFRRSLDPSLSWFNRFWTNCQLVATTTANLSFNSNTPSILQKGSASLKSANVTGQITYQNSSVSFSAGDAIVSAGQTVQIPIYANVLGSYPLRVLGLNLTVEPLDGSPAITQQVTFAPVAALGNPTITESKNPANYTGGWLNSSIAGLSGNALIGTLTVPIPAGASSSAAYAIHFDHASASPNGLASFPKHTVSGLVTLSSRTSSTYNDGIPDSWRLRYFGTVYNLLSQAKADADGDGMNNWQEYVAGTDPADPKSCLKANVGGSSQNRAITWPSVLGKQYVVERSTSMFQGNWTPVATYAGTGGNLEFDDSSTGKVYFYRVHVQ